MDIIRVLRVIEYVGPRDRVEDTVAKSVHGTKEVGNGLFIKAATIGAYPEILGQVPEKVAHVFEKHENCDIINCMICEGGLAWCTACLRGEGELAESCPGA